MAVIELVGGEPSIWLCWVVSIKETASRHRQLPVQSQSHLSYSSWALILSLMFSSIVRVHMCVHMCVSVCARVSLRVPAFCFTLLKSPHGFIIVPDYLILSWGGGFKPGSIWGLSVATGFILKSLLSPTKSQRLELICWLLFKCWSLKDCLETARWLLVPPSVASCSSSLLITSQVLVY